MTPILNQSAKLTYAGILSPRLRADETPSFCRNDPEEVSHDSDRHEVSQIYSNFAHDDYFLGVYGLRGCYGDIGFQIYWIVNRHRPEIIQ